MALLNKINLGIRSLYYSFMTLIKFNLLHKKKQLDPDSNLIVSLTTFPPRINHVILTLKSILNQSVKPARIMLYLSEEQFVYNSLPKSLKNLQEYGVTIEFVKGDIKSYKKLLYAKSQFPNQSIITADDDVCYPVNWLENMLNTSLKHPNDIIFYRGHIIFDNYGHILTYKKMLKNDTTGLRTSADFMPTGVCGILYPPNSMHKDWSNLDLISRLAPSADDIWFKAMTLLMGKKCTRVYNHNVLFPPVLGSQKFALKKINVDSEENNNDKQLKLVFEYYGLMR